MRNSWHLLAGAWLVSSGIPLAGSVHAAEAPKSPGRLREEASHVVIGEVKDMTTRTEFSDIEEGGFDHAIWCTITVQTVEKGAGIVPGDTIHVRCFRPKARWASFQWISLQGHQPIPEIGQTVRAYFREDQQYSVVHPNGFAPLQDEALLEAANVHAHWSLLFVLFLPLDLWVLVGLVMFPMVIWALRTRRPGTRRVLKGLLAVPVGLWTAGLVNGLLELLGGIETNHSGAFRLGVALLGSSLILPYLTLTSWLAVTALRRP